MVVLQDIVEKIGMVVQWTRQVGHRSLSDSLCQACDTRKAHVGSSPSRTTTFRQWLCSCQVIEARLKECSTNVEHWLRGERMSSAAQQSPLCHAWQKLELGRLTAAAWLCGGSAFSSAFSRESRSRLCVSFDDQKQRIFDSGRRICGLSPPMIALNVLAFRTFVSWCKTLQVDLQQHNHCEWHYSHCRAFDMNPRTPQVAHDLVLSFRR